MVLTLTLGGGALLCAIAWPCSSSAGCHEDSFVASQHGWLLPSGLAFLMLSGILRATAQGGWAVLSLALNMRRQRMAQPPLQLEAAAKRIGAGQIRFLETSAALAFCGGLRRPYIYVSREVVVRLPPKELDAVLLHELDHVRSREPLRRLLAWSLAEGFFFFPVLRWWSALRSERAELRADEAAIAGRGRQALARALLMLEDARQPAWLAALGSANAARVAQLLGAPLPPRQPDRWLLVGSGAGLITAWSATACIIHDVLPMALA
ncbi:MAG: hypothetical protein DLM67_13415 [Candidatus Nephthysia bennettiae]|nr:MAG: hypothetical protein DLM67_13415 [Candidatus Dormibacteraeota bacterium]